MSLAALRRSYARQMVALSGAEDARVEAAFAAVPREAFLGAPPWLLRGFFGRRSFDVADPVLVYQDVLVALDAARGVNNGSPSLHALMLHALAVAPGDRVLHLGIGGGYYTAILAELAGPDGRVTAVEFDTALATAARTNLKDRANVHVVHGDGAGWPPTETDCIYVNFAAALAADAWLDRLAIGGRLLFPLGVPHPDAKSEATHSAAGALLLVTRAAAGFTARHVSPCNFVTAEGPLAGSAEHRAALFAAFERGGVEFVASLRRGASPPERTWFWSPGWSLSYDPVASD